ncbi:hypothetical protein KC318_g2157 [Hortaea werneckii]|uniref:Fungal STAND N-terminal Goodbye domain-containing protein n=2 Tax=Hortaea werneckii TaxID=91943 RepID=A0A3M7B733_HORWE|nr:hypothetical protein KC334_g5288 [Hortaea werneckii]KAI7019223.1 hypothetical protein KC355_g3110 [Hortaea werneckii]KAI7195343.1 hypothetical protein KC324_g4689 [Hortaea werneckii]KAI7594160.1 hypothetical protein KC316_g1292 [Hortaea werneckii]KAI7673582.1 hypothetical protein KC318_g2157 [Hortaea werneckii]
MPTAVQREQDIAIDSFLRTTDFSPNTHKAIQAAGTLVKQDAIQQGWQPQQVMAAKAKDAAEEVLKAHEQRFRQALQDYKDHVKPKYQADIDLNLSAHHQWDDVIGAVEVLSETQVQRKDFWSSLRNKLHWFGENSSVFQQWSGLLPTQSNYFSVMCGGLKLIFNAAGRLQKIRDWIRDALLELPGLLFSTDKTLDAFDDERLHICSRQLMGKAFESLHWIIRELTRSAMKKGLMAGLKQDNYAKNLRDSLDEVKSLSEQFKRIADACAHEKLSEIDRTTSGLRQDVRTAYVGTSVQLEQILSALRSGFSLNLDRRYPLIEQTPMPPRVTSKADQERRRAKIRSSVCRRLNVDAAEVEDSLRETLASIWTAESHEQNRMHYLVADPQLANWVTSQSSSVLLINEASDRVPAKLVDAVRSANQSPFTGDQAPTLCLFHLGGQGFDEGYFVSKGPDGMLQNIIYQLLVSGLDLDAKFLRDMLRDHDNLSSDQLWFAFEQLLSQIPPQMQIFCVLGDLSDYEDIWEAETTALISNLVGLVRPSMSNKARQGCSIKVLLTCATPSRIVYHVLQPSEILEMPEDVPAVGDFSDRAWGLSGIPRFEEVDE